MGSRYFINNNLTSEEIEKEKEELSQMGSKKTIDDERKKKGIIFHIKSFFFNLFHLPKIPKNKKR